MAFSKDDLGPFLPLIGYATALAAAAWSIYKLLWRNETVWQMPLNIIPKAIKGVITSLLAVGLAILWFLATPDTIKLYLILMALFIISCAIIFVYFYSFVREHTYKKTVAINARNVKTETIVGGTVLTETGVKAKKMAKTDNYQTILAGLQFNEESLWTRKSIEQVKRKIMFRYLAIITLAFLALTSAALVVQVKLTNKPATDVINKADSPGLK